MADRDFYEILGVQKNASEDEIKKLSKIYLENGGEIKKVLEYLFKSEHFKSESLRFINFSSKLLILETILESLSNSL